MQTRPVSTESLSRTPAPLSTGTVAASSSGSISTLVVRTALKPAIAFGAEEWARYFGDVGVEPALPRDIEEILANPCPFWPGKRVGETHVLTLIPATVNGRPYTLDLLGELIKSPKGGGHKTAYSFYWEEAKKQLGGKRIGSAYWGLMTRDVVPGSRNKLLAEQEALLSEKGRGVGGLRGGMPTTLEAATSVMMEHVKTGVRLYSDSLLTYTRWQEVVNAHKMLIGRFSAAGLYVNTYFNRDEHIGVACFWKF